MRDLNQCAGELTCLSLGVYGKLGIVQHIDDILRSLAMCMGHQSERVFHSSGMLSNDGNTAERQRAKFRHDSAQKPRRSASLPVASAPAGSHRRGGSVDRR
ncbi:MAG: hypothetical protein IPN53_10090 [Comamonadaceae bacterium]|nr:hypothetical protein [Comamonadaceae bacterium]